MHTRIKVGTRPSLLALKQSEEIQRRLPNTILDVVTIETKGDKDKVTPLVKIEGSDFFTDEIESALLNKRIDVAVHSAKDLESNIALDLFIVAMTKSISPFDCLVSKGNYTLDSLPLNSIIGTSSRNRRDSIVRYRKDLIAKDIRGNVDERLRQLDRGNFDAIIVAQAALIRLGQEKRIAQTIPSNIIEPHPLQGRLAIQIRKDRDDLIEVFRGIDET
ncbi:hydroxymethylbilane synthase [Candidatus Omnitrophota bacterium]